ncbi:hypothetical protein GGS21DRAFT_503031 [Xylaria nigripes]|nr:hypothetical protein GGS21DRAFT_503031 [Xylaria nigripes]
MTDYDASSLPRPSSPKRPLTRSSIPRSSSSYGSYDTGESSAPAAFPYDTSIDAVSFHSSLPQNPKEVGSGPRSIEQGEQNPKDDIPRRRQSHKPRPSSGFLLSNTIVKEGSKIGLKHRGDDRWKSRIPVDARRGKSPLGSIEDSNSLGSADSSGALDGSNVAGAHSTQKSNSRGDDSDDRPRSRIADRQASRIPSFRPSSAPFGIDSTQIVSMALDLSESRRLASRRNISNPVALRLAQQPDSNPGRNLSLHLQQQRRTSRNISPRADAKLSPRIISTTPRINGSGQPSYDHDGNYTYRFSSSTLHRAQRAKEYMELMTQYRRVLQFLPPLKQEGRSRPSTSGANPTDSSPSLSGPQNRMARAYNPIQYIRNRKIRTRERKIVDGEAQGFGDVPRVTDWIDEVATYAAASPMAESPKLPPFASADECMRQQVLASNLPRPVAQNKSKRPRFEWSFDPADLLADVYWLEQGDNKFLIEDRHYAKIFTPKPAVIQSTTQVTEQHRPGLGVPAPQDNHDADGFGISDNSIAHSIKADVETTLVSTRDRARQKLQDLRGIHHKHNNPAYAHHDFLRFRRGSSSDSSDNESDRRRRGRSGTLSASGQDLLEKQMNEMLAKESQDELKQPFEEEADVKYLKSPSADLATPQQTSRVASRQHSRQGSRVEAVDQLDKVVSDKSNPAQPMSSGRSSLEVPAHLFRSSFDLDSSRPEVTPKGHRQGFVPAIGMDLSPNTSRHSSPARNRFLKVKNMFRDHEDRENDDKFASSIDLMGTPGVSTVTKDVPLGRSRSMSSTREMMMTKATHENSKAHRTLGSLSLRPDEQVGLRTIFKGGAKLDDMIRGGVSKVTDLIWKKDMDSSSSSGDDSDANDMRGRRREPALLSPEGAFRQRRRQRSARKYLDLVPSFKSTAESIDNPVPQEIDGFPGQILASHSSRSPRFEQLKPPRINVKLAPTLPGFENSSSQNFLDSELSDYESHSRDLSLPINRPRRASKELQSILSMHRPRPPVSYAGDKTRASDFRNWTVPDLASLSQNGLVSRRDVARLRTLIICSGIKAMEISRRANESQPIFGLDDKTLGLSYTEISRFTLEESTNLCVPQTQLFPTTAHILSNDIDHSIKMIEASASKFSTETAPILRQRVDAIHTRVAIDFMDMTRRAVDDADDVSHDIVDSQRLKLKSVVDAMDKMLRRRRRRFRYVRRAGWLAVEWVVVGFMWYVWFIVMIARILLGAGRGVVSVVRWLLWL